MQDLNGSLDLKIYRQKMRLLRGVGWSNDPPSKKARHTDWEGSEARDTGCSQPAGSIREENSTGEEI